MLTQLESIHPYLLPIIGSSMLFCIALLAYFFTKIVLVNLAHRVAVNSDVTWDDALVKEKVFHRLSLFVPALVIEKSIPLVPGWSDAAEAALINITSAWVLLTLAMTITAVLSAANTIYELRPGASERPIKGFIQLGQLVVYSIAAILVIATLIDRSPVILLSGVGAIAAVLLIVFKDTLLSLTASVQLASQQLVRVGDWLEVPEFGADGDVIDVALYTVTVQNWNKTITTIPTYRLVAGSFKNWRGMSESGGRRIKRSINIDINSIRFLNSEEVDRFAQFRLLEKYIPTKQNELNEYNKHVGQINEAVVNLRQLTNIGTLRAYIVNYLRNHAKIRQDMTLIVRQLQPGTTGLPIEIYCFSNDINWENYEDIQADIFDHICAIMPEFGLRLYQEPAGSDIEKLGQIKMGSE
jgi:miniconductance mechanosensitive channel